MDKEKVRILAAQCLSALETVCVAGEQNHIQLMGVRKSLREIIKETNCCDAAVSQAQAVSAKNEAVNV